MLRISIAISVCLTSIGHGQQPSFRGGIELVTVDVSVREGGRIIWMTDNANLGNALRRALEEFRSMYVLHFTPRGVTAGGFHTLQVSVKRGGLMVKARRGYLRGSGLH